MAKKKWLFTKYCDQHYLIKIYLLEWFCHNLHYISAEQGFEMLSILDLNCSQQPAEVNK